MKIKKFKLLLQKKRVKQNLRKLIKDIFLDLIYMKQEELQEVDEEKKEEEEEDEEAKACRRKRSLKKGEKNENPTKKY